MMTSRPSGPGQIICPEVWPGLDAQATQGTKPPLGGTGREAIPESEGPDGWATGARPSFDTE